MSKGSYRGGSTILGLGSRFWWNHPDDGNPPREIDAETLAIMEEHDRMRSQGIDPIAKLREEKRSAKDAKFAFMLTKLGRPKKRRK